MQVSPENKSKYNKNSDKIANDVKFIVKPYLENLEKNIFREK